MSRAELESDVLDGFWQEQPSLSPRWFYDETGSRLFDEITRLPEYYPTRAEREILEEHADDLARLPVTALHELGAGMSTKTRVLLDALSADGRSLHYEPLDVSEAVLLESAEALRREYPDLTVEPAIANFHDDLPPLAGEPGHRLLLFLGGTIGNFGEEERDGFVSRMRAALAPGDHFLLGADLVKEPGRLVAAYDDAAGVTAEFNRNVLRVVADTLGTRELDPEDFAHEARWDDAGSRIEMHLRALRDVEVEIPSLGRVWQLAKGESLRTEISRKFVLEDLSREVSGHGFEPVVAWTDRAGDYSLGLYRAVSPRATTRHAPAPSPSTPASSHPTTPASRPHPPAPRQ